MWGVKMIRVNKSYLPSIEEYTVYLKKIWESGWLTNNGLLVQELEQKLKDYLEVPFIQYVSNGTIALQLALKTLNITKEVITTPFSYVATTTSILWENCKPVFVDINDKNFCIDADKIQDSITENTEAILATHVFGYPCDVEKIERIARKYGLKVIYDAAHAFGTRINKQSILNFGDISTLSFHATKLFHTVEGGALITNSGELNDTISLMKSFGYKEDEYYYVGINGKNSEFHAAMGLSIFPKIKDFISQRKKLSETYDICLSGIGLQFPEKQTEVEYNYSYYPVIFQTEKQMLTIKNSLAQQGIDSRRYFYPSLNQLPYLSGARCLVSENISRRILCLPLYYELSNDEVIRISNVIKRTILISAGPIPRSLLRQ